MYHDELTRGTLTNVAEDKPNKFYIVHQKTGEYLNWEGEWQAVPFVFNTVILAFNHAQRYNLPDDLWRLENIKSAA